MPMRDEIVQQVVAMAATTIALYRPIFSIGEMLRAFQPSLLQLLQDMATCVVTS